MELNLPVSNFEYKEFNTTKVRIKPYRNGFRFEITFANGKKPNHVYNTRAAAKKGLKDLEFIRSRRRFIVDGIDVLTEIVKQAMNKDEEIPF